MDLNWSPDDSSSFLHWDECDAEASTDAQNAPDGEVVRPRGNGLLAIDDSDFEALIEILGTEGDRERVKRAAGNEVAVERLITQGWEPPQHRDEVAPAVTRPSSNGAGKLRVGSEVPQLPSRAVVGSARPSSSDASAPRRSTMPLKIDTSSSPTRRRRSTVETTRTAQTNPAIARTSSPGPSRPREGTTSQQNTRSKSGLGFTQSKQLLGSSIDDVQDQVAELRTRLQMLKGEVEEFAPHLYRRVFDSANTREQDEPTRTRRASEDRRPNDAKGKGKAVQWSNSVNSRHRESDLEIISSLTEDEVKNALANVCRTLRISPSSLTSITPNRHPEPPIPPSSLSDIARALKLLSDLDELVWRNTNQRGVQSGPSSRNAYDIYDEENIRAISDRVRLWERTARSRTGRRPGP